MRLVVAFHIQTLAYLNDLASSSKCSLLKAPPLPGSTVDQPFFLWFTCSGQGCASLKILGHLAKGPAIDPFLSP